MSDCSFLPKSCQISLSSAVLQYSLCFSGERVPSCFFAVCLVRLSPKRQEQKILGSLPLFVNIKLCTFGGHLASLGFSVLREKGEMDAKILQMLNTEYEYA